MGGTRSPADRVVDIMSAEVEGSTASASLEKDAGQETIDAAEAVLRAQIDRHGGGG